MRVVDSVQGRLEEMKYVSVLEQDIRHRVPVEVIVMLGQRVEGRLIQPSPSMLDSRWCVLQHQVERHLLRRSAGTWHHHGSPKRVWVYPLHRRAPEILSAPFDHPLLTREEPRVINLNALPLAGDRASLLEVLGGLADPRAKRGIRHQVAATLTMVTAAGLSGCGRSFRSAADFIADLPQEALARLGARYHPVKRRYIAPEESTIRRHVKMIDADQADRLTGGWLLAQVTAGRIAARRQRPVASRQIGGQVIVGAGCTAPPCSILAPRQPRIAIEEVPLGPVWQEIAPVFLDVVIAVVCKNLSH